MFPDIPDEPLAEGVSNLYASFRTWRNRSAHAMAVRLREDLISHREGTLPFDGGSPKCD